MPGIDHPDALLEQAHLQQTVAVIGREAELIEARIADQKADLQKLRAVAMDEYTELMMRELMHRVTTQLQRELRLAQRKAYFTRIDFRADGRASETFYIGKYGVLRFDTLEVVVVDWRSPVANLYYAGQVGRVSYRAPDGAVDGDLLLKRLISVEGEQLTALFDTDIATQDVHLQSVLGQVTSDRLKEVVTTIQTEQNNIIRFDPGRNVIVQGVAGSGKTTIALHRIAYLLYVLREKLSSGQMMIIAPSPLFLDYISAVLPDLGVDDVLQTTFPGLAAKMLGEHMPAVLPDDRLDGLARDQRALEEVTRICRFKGSLQLVALIEAYLDGVEQALVPDEEIRFGPVALFTRQGLRDFYLTDLGKFPFSRRMEELRRTVKRRAKDALVQVNAWIVEECEKRAANLRVLAIPESERRGRMQVLYQSRDDRLRQAKEAVDPFVKDVCRRFSKVSLLPLYEGFWRSEPQGLSPQDAQTFALCRERTLAHLQKKRVEAEDVAPLLLIARRALGLRAPDVRHAIMDEAQDFSPLQLQLLRRLFPLAPMTLVGDLQQGVHAYRGLRGWNEAQEAIGGAELMHLRTSYRSTVQIVEAAQVVAGKFPVPGQVPALPVLRQGPAPDFCAAAPGDLPQRLVQRLQAYRAEGFHSVCIIEKTRDRAAALHKQLKPLYGELRLMDPESGDYHGGLYVAAATDVKGLEFDCVLIADCSAGAYRQEPLDARLLYVAMTRPLHRLAGYYTGEITPLLRT